MQLPNSNSRICNKCVLCSTTPGITFDAAGVCNYCRDYQPMQVKGEADLVRLLDRHKREGASRKYDCMVGLSGGRDSTFTLLKLVRDYHMRVLAVNYANPFTSPQARANIEETCAMLQVDKVVWQYASGVQESATRKAMRVWGKRPSSKMIPIICAHCKSSWPRFFAIAREQRVPLVVIGSNPLETASFKQAGFGGARSYHRLKNLPQLIGRSAGELLDNPSYLSLSWPLTFRMFLMASHSSPYLRWRYADIEVVRLFDYLRWSEKEVEGRIRNEVGWRKSDEVEATWRFDCRLDYVRRYMYATTVGVTELQDLFSKMIRENMITRDEALQRLASENRVPRAIVESVLGELDLSLDDLHLTNNGYLQ